MKVSIVNLLAANSALDELNQIFMPIKTSFKLSRASKAVKAVLEDFELTRKKLIEQYAAKDDQGKLKVEEDHYVFNNDDYTLYNNEFAELVKSEVELQVDTISIEDFGEIKVKASTLNSLGFLID